MKAAFAAQNSIHFESNALVGETPLSTAELCVIANELLTRACEDAAAYQGERRVRFTAFPGENALTMERSIPPTCRSRKNSLGAERAFPADGVAF